MILQVKDSILKAKSEGKEFNKKEIVMAAVINLGVSKRTASEYVDVALMMIDSD